jgi:hypothetical protein
MADDADPVEIEAPGEAVEPGRVHGQALEHEADVGHPLVDAGGHDIVGILQRRVAGVQCH